MPWSDIQIHSGTSIQSNFLFAHETIIGQNQVHPSRKTRPVLSVKRVRMNALENQKETLNFI